MKHDWNSSKDNFPSSESKQSHGNYTSLKPEKFPHHNEELIISCHEIRLLMTRNSTNELKDACKNVNISHKSVLC